MLRFVGDPDWVRRAESQQQQQKDKERRVVSLSLHVTWSSSSVGNAFDYVKLRNDSKFFWFSAANCKFQFLDSSQAKILFFRLIKFSITNILAPATLAVCFFHYFRLNRCVRARGFESFRFVRLRCRWTEFGSRDNFLYFIFFRVSWKKKNAHNEAKCKAQSGANTGEA